MKLPTDCVKFTEPTLARVSPVVTKMAHTDSDAQKIYEDDQYANDHGLSRNTGTDAAAEVLGISRAVESGRFCYTEEVQSQVLPVSEADQEGTVPAGPVGPDLIID